MTSFPALKRRARLNSRSAAVESNLGIPDKEQAARRKLTVMNVKRFAVPVIPALVVAIALGALPQRLKHPYAGEER